MLAVGGGGGGGGGGVETHGMRLDGIRGRERGKRVQWTKGRTQTDNHKIVNHTDEHATALHCTLPHRPTTAPTCTTRAS